MEFIRGSDGNLIRLTNERVVKILRDHEEMAGNMDAIPRTLASPDAVTSFRSDSDVCESNDDRFVLTAYLTGRVR